MPVERVAVERRIRVAQHGNETPCVIETDGETEDWRRCRDVRGLRLPQPPRARRFDIRGARGWNNKVLYRFNQSSRAKEVNEAPVVFRWKYKLETLSLVCY